MEVRKGFKMGRKKKIEEEIKLKTEIRRRKQNIYRIEENVK